MKYTLVTTALFFLIIFLPSCTEPNNASSLSEEQCEVYANPDIEKKVDTLLQTPEMDKEHEEDFKAKSKESNEGKIRFVELIDMCGEEVMPSYNHSVPIPEGYVTVEKEELKSRNEKTNVNGTFSKGFDQDLFRTGQLTAGEINDFSKWKLWDDVSEGDLALYQMRWRVYPSQRFSTLVQTEDGSPVSDCKVELIDKSGQVIWTSRTDNMGRAELWQNIFDKTKSSSPQSIVCSFKGKTEVIKRPKEFSKGINSAVFDVPCDYSDNVDILFAVDATGSMGDEIEYLKSELSDIIRKTVSNKPELEINLGSIFYRCPDNSYVTKASPFSKRIENTVNFIAQQSASEGGIEAVEVALEEAINNYSWSNQARTRILFMVLDEPPGVDDLTVSRLHKTIQKAAEKGIRIVPLVSSGVTYDVDKSLEYLMRSMALATNGTYAFLTNHSGIGNNHTAPSTDTYQVEKLNDLLVRIINQFTDVQDCKPITIPSEMDSTLEVITTSPMDPNQKIDMSLYPNPAHDFVNMESSEIITEVLLFDSNGRLLLRSTPNSKAVRFELDEFTNGFYIAKCLSGKMWSELKFIVSK